MKRTTRILLAAVTAAGAGLAAATLPSCITPQTCNYMVLDIPQVIFYMGLGDTTVIRGTTVSDCPDRVGPGVTFTTPNPGIINVTALSDTTARIIAVGQGDAKLNIASRDHSALTGQVQFEVGAPNPDVLPTRTRR